MKRQDDGVTLAEAKALAQKMGGHIIVRDCDGIQLWTIGPKLGS